MSILKQSPIRASNAVPDPRGNRFGKITELHFHSDGNVTFNLNDLAARYTPIFNRSKLIRDTFILSRECRNGLSDLPECCRLSEFIEIHFLRNDERNNDISMVF